VLLTRVLLFIAVLLAFGASVTHGFHFDDYSVIHGAPWSAWRTRPITWLSFVLNAKISGYPAFWHLISLLSHLTAVLLLYQLLLQLLSPSAALIGAAFFAVHPIQAESVAYVYSRSTLFSTALSIVVCLLWIHGRRWSATVCFALALMAKEDCATLPLVILVFEIPNLRKRWAPLAVMMALSLTAGISTLAATRVVPGSGAGFSAGISPLLYLFHEGYVIVRYLQLIVVPFGFTIDPEINASPTLSVAAWLVLGLITALAIWKKNRWILAGLLLLIPSSSIFPLADLAADHRMYLPMAAFAGCAGVWLARLPKYSSLAVIVILIGISATRMTVWASDERLWTEAVTRAPDKLRPRLQLSRALEPDRALSELQSAQARFPASPEVDAELGRVYLEKGQPALALQEFGKVLGQAPGDPHALNNRGVALRALGQEDAARQDFGRALKVDPCFAEARDNLGLPACK
jgi:hypothetical protein